MLEFDFPAIAPANVGCRLDDSPRPASRRYYWLATAQYPGIHYPDNHFQQTGVSFNLPPSAPATLQRLDSAIAAQQILVNEAGGEPPMTLKSTRPARTRVTIEPIAVGAAQFWRVHLLVEGRDAVEAFLRPHADSVSLGWCQRDGFMTYRDVPLERG
jgi:hypothetical protein